MSSASSQSHSSASPSGSSSDPVANQPLSHLSPLYLFRYPFTITALKWSLSLSTLFALHTYIRYPKNGTLALQRGIMAAVLGVFPIWGFFMTKFTLYQGSIEQYEVEERQKGDYAGQIEEYVRWKVGANKTTQSKEKPQMEEVMAQYINKVKATAQKNSILDRYLEGVTPTNWK